MAIKATEVKRGQALMFEGQLQVVLATEHVKPGKGPAYVQAKMKNVETGTIKVNRLNSSDRVEDVSIERRPWQYLYDAGGRGEGPFVFMNSQTFDQMEITSDVIGRDQSQWLTENLECMVVMYQDRPLGVELPASIELKVTETAAQAKGATATNQPKEAVVETGARVRVPPFVEVGQVIRVNPETGEYQGKA
ncbi:MAG: elongation factor P [Planctomycetota bacterium]|jgi:elongation factor P